MAYFVNPLGGLVNGIMSRLWNAAPKTPYEFFIERLALAYQPSFDREACVSQCVRCVENVLTLDDCNLSGTSVCTIQGHLHAFDCAVNQNPHVNGNEAEDLKDKFKMALCMVIEEKWSSVMAQSFHIISLISDRDERIVAAQKWTSDYFSGLAYLLRVEEPLTAIVYDRFVFKLQQKTASAFHAYSHEVIQNRMKTIQAEAERDGIAFEKKMQIVIEKAENAPNSLTSSEREYLASIDNMASCIAMNFPEIDKNKELMEKCIWNGHALDHASRSIISFNKCSLGTSWNLFSETFKDT